MLLGPEGPQPGLMGVMGASLREDTMDTTPLQVSIVVEQLRKLELPGDEQACFGSEETVERLLLCSFILSPPFSLTLWWNDG